MNQNEELILRLENFINNKDVSVQNANNIEILLEELYLADDDIQDFITALAMYIPEGGDYLYDKNRIITEAKFILKKIKTMGMIKI